MNPLQRMRLRFSRGNDLKFISHLDIMRLWLRAFTRAGMPLSFSEGFNPHPRISLASPLALGITSEAELMDVYLDRIIPAPLFQSAVARQLPAGIVLFQAQPVAIALPALAALVRFAEYEVDIEDERPRSAVETAIDTLLESDKLPWQHRRDTGTHSYDLRALVEDIWLPPGDGPLYHLGMRLRNDNSGSGRPEQVTAALGFVKHPSKMHRTRLIFDV